MNITVPSMQDLLEAGVHFGHQVRRGNPKMGDFIFGARDGIHIIDLAKSEEKLKEATQAAYDYGKDSKIMLVVGTKKQAKEIVEKLAKDAQTPYLTSHWVGGLLTNFEEIKKNIKKLTELKDEKEKGTLTRYTKREQLLIARKIEKFERDLGGVAQMQAVPDVLFIVDTVADNTAVKEALRMNIPIIGFADTNANPQVLDYPIPANDDGIKSIKIVCDTILEAYNKGKKEAAAGKVIAEEKKQKEEQEAAQKAALTEAVVEETAVIEQEIEAATVADSSRKVE